jgi:hypothetical protein
MRHPVVWFAEQAYLALISEPRRNTRLIGIITGSPRTRTGNRRFVERASPPLLSMHHLPLNPWHSIVLPLLLVNMLTHPLSVHSARQTQSSQLKPPLANDGPTRSTEHWQLNNSGEWLLLLLRLHCIFSDKIRFIYDALILSSIQDSHQWPRFTALMHANIKTCQLSTL